MTRALTAPALAVLLATSTPVFAETARLAGTPITADTLVARAEMIRIADALDAAVDTKDWALARSFFTDRIDVDFASLIGGTPANIPADALIAGWSDNLTDEKTSFHLRGNHRVTHQDDGSATMLSHGYAWNR
ncbi:MAG: nuclear transport factor 2 family protein, partial [Pseudomonadota bacterium]